MSRSDASSRPIQIDDRQPQLLDSVKNGAGTVDHTENTQPREVTEVAESTDISGAAPPGKETNLQNGSQRYPLQRTATTASAADPPFSIFTLNQKRFIVFMASWAGFFSTVSANIYFPALNPLARDLKVSNALINLTITTYMIFQGLAPSVLGTLADAWGRRPAYIVCFVVYIAANIGLALQNNYAALMVLRCLQSTGSSATIAMASAVVSDVSTPAERGAYMGFTISGSLIGPAIGPVLGGLLAQSLRWSAIFWFLAILAGIFLCIFLVFFPECARTQVGNGSIPPKGWDMSLMNYLAARKANRENALAEKDELEHITPLSKRKRSMNPLASLAVVFDKENALLLFYNGFLFAAFYDIGSSIPSQYAEIFQFNELQIGLCYIPYGVGSIFAVLVNGQILDRNFARWCRKLGVVTKKGRDQDLREFPIEKARLQTAFPAVYCTACLVLIYGWVLHNGGPLAPLLVILFFTSFSMTVAFNVTNTLLVDFYPGKAATATAASNLVRCLLGAGATAVIVPMIDGMGRGWTFTFLSFFLLATSPMLWLVFFRGMKWREQRRLKGERQQEKDLEYSGTSEKKELSQNHAQTQNHDAISVISAATTEVHAEGEDESDLPDDTGRNFSEKSPTNANADMHPTRTQRHIPHYPGKHEA